ncbi:MAG: MFS transporter [Gammaproteobacteria bacterium]
MPAEHRLNPAEWSLARALAATFFLRMLGLFMLIPVLALYVDRLAGATPLLVGLALGIYGLTQALCQVPFGRLSDRLGRRPVIVAGLAIFGLGSVIAAAAQSIWPVLIGRAVQGAGAVSGASLALAADHVRPEQLTKVNAVVGISIGAAFSCAFVVGPALDAALGLAGLFLAAALLAVLAILIVLLALPRGRPATTPARATALGEILATPGMAVFFTGVFALHAVLTASFVALPVTLADGLGVAPARHYVVYLPVLGLSVLAVGPPIMLSVRRGLGWRFFLAAVALLGGAELALFLAWDTLGVYAALVVFFTAFNFIEASMPGLVARAAPADGRGAALGAYASCQFFGMFAGGALGGATASAFGYAAVPLACAVVCLLWLGACRRVAGERFEAPRKPDAVPPVG